MHQSNHTPEQRGVDIDQVQEWEEVMNNHSLPSKGQEGEAERKAKELVEKFWHEISGVPAHCGVDVHSKDSYVILAKQCALICVDEILKAINGDGISWDINSYFLNGKHVSCKDYKQFWQQVRHNIVNL